MVFTPQTAQMQVGLDLPSTAKVTLTASPGSDPLRGGGLGLIEMSSPLQVSFVTGSLHRRPPSPRLQLSLGAGLCRPREP